MRLKPCVDENSDEEDQQLEQKFDQNSNKVLTKTLDTKDFDETIGKNFVSAIGYNFKKFC
jgi:hypothetical protein